MDFEEIISVDDKKVIKYIKETYGIDDVFDDDDIKLYARRNFCPEDVFGNFELESWAESNGYVKEE